MDIGQEEKEGFKEGEEEEEEEEEGEESDLRRSRTWVQ